MTNAVVMNENIIQVSAELMRAMAEDAKVMAATTMDEAYEAAKRYGTIAKEDFNKVVEFMTPFLSNYEYSGEKCRLSDDDLDMVAGGWSLWSSICSVVNKVADTVSDIWDASPTWVKGIVVGAAICAGIGAVVCAGGAILGGVCTGYLAATLADAGVAMTAGAVASYIGSIAAVGGAIGAGVGGTLGACFGAAAS